MHSCSIIDTQNLENGQYTFNWGRIHYKKQIPKAFRNRNNVSIWGFVAACTMNQLDASEKRLYARRVYKQLLGAATATNLLLWVCITTT